MNREQPVRVKKRNRIRKIRIEKATDPCNRYIYIYVYTQLCVCTCSGVIWRDAAHTQPLIQYAS